MANRNFNKKQAYEKEVKELYAKGSFTYVAATAVANLTNDITFTSVAAGPSRNTNTLTIQVAAAAANPTNTVLAAFTGTSSAITVTITPNDGTNNGATAVNLTTAQLAELINNGTVSGKSVTVTDGSSLRALQTATGGGAQNLADGGEGDAVVATFSGGDVTASMSSSVGFLSMTRSATGVYDIVLDDEYNVLKSAKALLLKSTGEDIRFNLKSESVGSKLLSLIALTGATETDPSNGSSFLLKLDVKNGTEI